MTSLKRFGSVVGIWLLLAVLAGAQAQTVPASPDQDHAAALTGRVLERENLGREREAIDTTLQQAEVACYQRFAVEDCLSQARRHAREARAQIHQRELVLDSTERRERAAQRLSDVQERERTRVPPTPHLGSAAGVAGATKTGRKTPGSATAPGACAAVAGRPRGCRTQSTRTAASGTLIPCPKPVEGCPACWEQPGAPRVWFLAALLS